MDELHFLKYIEEDVKYLKTLGVNEVIYDEIITNGCGFISTKRSREQSLILNINNIMRIFNCYMVEPVNFGVYNIYYQNSIMGQINSYVCENININEVIDFIKNMMSEDDDLDDLYLDGMSKKFEYEELFPHQHA